MARTKRVKRAKKSVAQPYEKPKAATKASRNGSVAEDDILTSPKSKLVDVDLVQFFADPATWSKLDENEKAMIRDLVAPHIPVNAEGLPTKDYLKYDTDFRQSVRIFQSDLGAGRFDPEWQRQAAEAMEERANGQFDQWKEQNFEQFWGEKAVPTVSAQPNVRVDKKAEGPGTGSTQVRLMHMFRGGAFQIGDMWNCTWLFKDKHTGDVVFEKQLEIVSINYQKGFGTFAIASAKAKIVDDSNRVLYDAKTLTDLESKVLGLDGRTVQGTKRKSWKDFQCSRDGTAQGSLWDMREIYYASQ